MIQKVADYGMWAFALCVVLEIVKIPINLMNGFPPFFEFLNLKYSFSPDNSLFILYWSGLVGIITTLLTNAEPKMPTFGRSVLDGNSAKSTPFSKSEKQIKSERDMAVKKERQFIQDTINTRNIDKTIVTKNDKNSSIFKDVTRTPRSKVHLTMFDFFNHHRYKEFEVSESIDLKTTNLEVIEIYKLFKAYLLLKYNIEVIDINE